ncbi:MAG: hypothetical protein H6577_19080 [Lewinellaceae bacterium]|nr:hypothetical protein [Saprospiraceae bacterium]MCB9340229.1 hypothetical protein [Lewinellaceae bacterium]
MTPALRKYHRHVWFFMAGLLPVIFIAAITVIPQKRPDPNFRSHQPEALPQVLKTVESLNFMLRLRASPDTAERQLELVIKQPLHTPATLVYLSNNEKAQPNDGVFLGSLGAKGTYRYKIGTAMLSQNNDVLLFDPIKNITIETLQF